MQPSTSLFKRFRNFLFVKNDTSDDIWIRQLIWTEYRAKNNKQQARINIKSKFGLKSISTSTINYWYKRFKSGKISLFKKYAIAPAIQTLSNGEEVRVYLTRNIFYSFRKTHLTPFYSYLTTN
jgi:hypothetical protein